MEHIGYLLADNSRMARWAFDRQVRDTGVTGPQARLLLTLDRSPGETQSHYAERLEVEPITLCRMVDRLEEAGLVERRACDHDRRARRLHLTTASRSLIEGIRQKLDSMVEEMLTGLSENDRTEFRRMLTIVGANLSAHRDLARAANG